MFFKGAETYDLSKLRLSKLSSLHSRWAKERPKSGSELRRSSSSSLTPGWLWNPWTALRPFWSESFWNFFEISSFFKIIFETLFDLFVELLRPGSSGCFYLGSILDFFYIRQLDFCSLLICFLVLLLFGLLCFLFVGLSFLVRWFPFVFLFAALRLKRFVSRWLGGFRGSAEVFGPSLERMQRRAATTDGSGDVNAGWEGSWEAVRMKILNNKSSWQIEKREWNICMSMCDLCEILEMLTPGKRSPLWSGVANCKMNVSNCRNAWRRVL